MDHEIDIGEVFSHYGEHTGKRMVQCLFHEDKTPSCSVNYAKGVFNCHSCGRAGNGWTIIMEKENVDFGGAREFAESTLGVAVGDVGGGGEQVLGSSYGGRRTVSSRKGDRLPRSGWKPPWRSH